MRFLSALGGDEAESMGRQDPGTRHASEMR